MLYFKSSLQFVALLENYNPCKMCFLELGRHPLWSSVILDCSAIKELQESSPLTKFYDCSSQFLKSVTTTATSIFDVQATGGDNDEEEDEAKWDNDFEKKNL